MLEMAGAFSHEINQPMQVIVTATELLLYRFPDNLEVAKSVEKILQAATRMSEITSRLSKTTTYKSKKYVGETRIIDAGVGE
jgi:signal transduction histidine kinase